MSDAQKLSELEKEFRELQSKLKFNPEGSKFTAKVNPFGKDFLVDFMNKDTKISLFRKEAIDLARFILKSFDATLD